MLACSFAAATTGSLIIAKLGRSDASGEALLAAIGWIWQSFDNGARGVFPQCPAGLQHPARELGNMKYTEHDTQPPHSSVISSSNERPVFASALNVICVDV
jgi:hypothetical protein